MGLGLGLGLGLERHEPLLHTRPLRRQAVLRLQSHLLGSMRRGALGIQLHLRDTPPRLESGVGVG